MTIFIEPTFSEYYDKRPLVLVDIGASGGLEPNWKRAEKYLQIIGFEPQNDDFNRLSKTANKISRGHRYFDCGLYNKKTVLELFVTKEGRNSSILKPNRMFIDKFPEAGRFDIIAKERIETDSLDNVLAIHDIEGADFIKIDTQGSELFILQGAKGTLKNFVFGLEVEVEFVEQYQNQPLFSDVDSFVRNQGFQLFDIKGYYWKRTIGKDYGKKKGQIILGDALYLKKVENLLSNVEKIEGSYAKKVKILKAISICFLYGYYDYAMEVLDVTSNLFNKTERQIIEKRIKCNTWKIPDFKGKGKIAHMVYTLWSFLRPTHNGWATSDRELGNR